MGSPNQQAPFVSGRTNIVYLPVNWRNAGISVEVLAGYLKPEEKKVRNTSPRKHSQETRLPGELPVPPLTS